MLKLVQFGAGNIGRSFIGQLFSLAGYEVAFVDVDRRVLDALNSRRSYRVEIADDPPGEIVVRNVRGVDGNNRTAVVDELITARVAGTSVGAGALRFLYPVIAEALVERRRRGEPPLDMILCENLHGAAAIVRAGLQAALPAGFPLDEAVGLVETSIGKMVPTAPAAARDLDPLLVRAERFNTLIVDAQGFRNEAPQVPGLELRSNMAAYVDRKLYIHNLGHAAVAYLAALRHPELKTIGEAVLVPEVRSEAERAMSESARALARAYPGEFTPEDLSKHIRDLLHRFANPALGDTVFRVGRDIRRKLSREDRITGAILTDLREGVQPTATALTAAAAIRFRATGDDGQMDPSDAAFAVEDFPRGIEHILGSVCGLDPSEAADRQARDAIVQANDRLQS